MKYEIYDKAEIQNMLNDYLKFDEDVLPFVFKENNIIKNSDKYNVDTFIKLYDSKTKKISHKEFVTLLTNIKNCCFLDEDSIKVVNKLIGDRKIFNKIRFCFDGSYRNNRIWGTTIDGMYKIQPEIGYELWQKLDYQEPIIDNPKKYIDWLYNHFDILFLQIPLSVEQLINEIELDFLDDDSWDSWTYWEDFEDSDDYNRCDDCDYND